MQGHAYGLPVTYTCKEGRDNEAARIASRPLVWDFGRNVEALNLCHVCRTPLPCGISHVVIGS